MTSKLLASFRDKALLQEDTILFEKASFSKNHSRYFGTEEDHRLPYKRDVDRILHSKAFSRYIDKTQVVYLVDNDHITQRSLHVQLVSNFSRGIAEILRLNLDLVEAISLGHDVGHPPFGHEGEGYLSELCLEYTGKPFAHPWQSVRLFSVIEPMNLGLAVLDGFLCHDGGMRSASLVPRFGKTWNDHFRDLERKLQDPEETIIPGTLEGCLVKICDTMSYVGRDIEDAISLGILKRDEVPKTPLGSFNREILRTLAQDLIQNSYERGAIVLSEEMFSALHALRAFNFERIYFHPKLKKESEKIRQSYRLLFEFLLKDFERKEKESYLFREFLQTKPKEYLERSDRVQLVIDYISGMTDSYFVRTLNKIFIPSRIEIF